jgi:hypothetical protein
MCRNEEVHLEKLITLGLRAKYEKLFGTELVPVI